MRSERGMVSVELAFVVLLAALVSIGLSYLLALVIQLGQLQAIVGEVARQQARGDSSAAHRAQSDAPLGTTVTVRGSGGDVVVQAELRSQPRGRWIPAMPLSARAVVAREGG